MNALSLVRCAAEVAPEIHAPRGIETKLASLRLERVGLSERQAQITAVLAKLEAVEACESETLAQLAELGGAEVASAKRWASEGCAGPAPTVDMSKRDTLVRKLGEAMANAEAMRAAAAELKNEDEEISSRLAALNERLEQCALDALSERFADELGGLVTLGEEVQSKQARVYGCTAFMREIAERHQMAGRNDKAIAIFKRLEQLAKLDEKPEFAPSVAAVAAAAPAWKASYERFINV
jgi:DNA repair exonuclease SbcCD ATPase subunit